MRLTVVCKKYVYDEAKKTDGRLTPIYMFLSIDDGCMGDGCIYALDEG